MKRFSIGILFGLIFGLLLATTTFALAEQQIKLIVNGKEIQSDVPPQIIDNRTMIPARFLAEALGAKVDWDAQNNSVIVTSPYKLLKVNGEQTTWPYWYENGNLYLEYRNAIEVLRMVHPTTTWSVGYSPSTSYLTANNAVYMIPYITKGDFKTISISLLSSNRNLINFDFDQTTGNLTLIPFK